MEKFLIKKPRFSERAEESSSEKSSNEELAKNTTPPKKQKRYTQKYKSEWESSRNWLKELDKQAYCKLCHKSLSNDIYNLNRHALSFKHQQAAQNTCKQICLDECLQNTAPGEVQKIRNTLMVVAYCVQHSHPFTSMDTLPLLIHTLSPSDKPIKCGSTKATEIVNTILGPYAMNEIAKELREKHFSLIIDEGTDISMTKCLTVIVRYIPKGKSVVIDRFFGLVQPADGKAQSLYEALKDKILSLNIPLSNAIGFATDNAFVMQGKNESIRKKIQENNKDIFYLGCTCHSLNLCSSAASKQLPPKLEKLVKNIYNFFSTSSNRQKEFKKFQEHFGTPCHKILGLSVTRWLSLEAVIERVIEQWVALRHFFLLFTYEELHETNASNILEELNDTNMTYFLFLNHILKKINALNKFYQSQGTLIHLLHIQMKTFFMQILQNFIKIEHISLATDYHNEIFHLPESEMFFGLKCTEFMQNDNIDADVIRKNLLKYYISLCDQIKLRFDFNDNKLKLLEYFDPKKIQDGKMPTITELLKAFPFHKVSDEVLNDEWRSLMAYDREKLNNIFKDDYVKGWIELGREKNILERLLFENLSKYMCSLAVLPHSSAAAERSFSIMKDLKSAKRNRLNLETVSNQIFVKELCGKEKLYIPSNALISFYKQFKFIDGKFIPIG